MARHLFRPTYVSRRGFLDGRAGLTYCRLLAIHEYPIMLKTRELRAQPLAPPTRQGAL